MSGYFAIPRDLYESIKIEHRLKGYGVTVAVLNELAARVRYNGNISGNLEIGQCFIGRDELAIALGTTSDKVRSSLKVLEKLTSISPVGTQKGTIITILDKRIFSSSQIIDPQKTPKESPLTDQYSTNTLIHNTGGLFKISEEEVNKLCLAYVASRQEFEIEYMAMEEWLADPKKNKKGRDMSFRFASNWMKKWEGRPKEDTRYKDLVSKLFAPHPNPNVE